MENLIKEYVDWQKRLDVLEEQRPGVYAKLLEFQQQAIIETGHEDALAQAKVDLQDLDLKIEASVDKLCQLWGELKNVVSEDVEAQMEAEPQIREALAQEFQDKCKEAAGHLVKGLKITESLGIHRGYLARYLGLVEEDRKKYVSAFGPPAIELEEAINRLLETPSAKTEPTHIDNKNSLQKLVGIINSLPLRNRHIETTITRAIMDHGGRNPLINMGAGDMAHKPRKE